MEWRLGTGEKSFLDDIIERIRVKIDAEVTRANGNALTAWENGAYRKSRDIYDWTNGFWSGQLWQMYHAFGEARYLEEARAAGSGQAWALDGFTGLNHDVGFMFLHTVVADYRLTGDETARERALHAATILAGRFNPAGGFIRAWDEYSPDPARDTSGWIIIDCMMKLPLLCWAGEITGDPRFVAIASAHADTTLRALVHAPAQPVLVDTSAGLCAACGLMQLGELCPAYQSALYLHSAWLIVTHTIDAHGNFDPERDGMVENYLANYHDEGTAGQKPCIYADYFLVEAILRLFGRAFLIW